MTRFEFNRIIFVYIQIKFVYIRSREDEKFFYDKPHREDFNRADLQVVWGLLLNDVGGESDIDNRTYKQRLVEDSAPMLRFLESTYPDGEKRDAVFADVSQAITAY